MRQFVDHGYSRKNTKNDLMDGQRAVFERATLSQRLLLFRRRARSKKSNDMTGGLGLAGPALSRVNPLPQGPRRPEDWPGCQMGFGQSMNRCSRANRRAR
ncbi:hypothetical protein F6X59_04375 [Pseudomonas sp. MN1F]|nr:hypothetical protein [Pseudomonas sp. MN1F]